MYLFKKNKNRDATIIVLLFLLYNVLLCILFTNVRTSYANNLIYFLTENNISKVIYREIPKFFRADKQIYIIEALEIFTLLLLNLLNTSFFFTFTNIKGHIILLLIIISSISFLLLSNMSLQYINTNYILIDITFTGYILALFLGFYIPNTLRGVFF